MRSDIHPMMAGNCQPLVSATPTADHTLTEQFYISSYAHTCIGNMRQHAAFVATLCK